MNPDYKNALKKAQEVLQENGIEAPPTPIVDIAQSYGLDVEEIEFPDDKSNISGVILMDKNLVLVNKQDSPKRKIFTVAHELGHFLLHKEIIKKDPELTILFRKPLNAPDPVKIEKEANAFAAELLVPSKILKEYLSKSIDNTHFLAKIFGVSQDVISYRIKDEKRNRF